MLLLIFNFQFPVGMSNRSYQRLAELCDEKLGKKAFQFPVGMSNRSYSYWDL